MSEPAYYVVDDVRDRPTDSADFHVKGYDIKGRLLLHTSHIGESSMLTECAAWERRGAIRKPQQFS